MMRYRIVMSDYTGDHTEFEVRADNLAGAVNAGISAWVNGGGTFPYYFVSIALSDTTIG